MADTIKEVLLVDDKVDIQEILADFLRNNGYRVEAYENGKTALARLQTKDFHLIITDLIMPKQDGFSLIHNIKEKQKNLPKKTPIIIMTGGSQTMDFQESLEQLEREGHPVLHKPFTKEKFLEAVNTALFT